MGSESEKRIADAKQFKWKDSKIFTEDRIGRNYQEGLRTKFDGVSIKDLTKRELIAVINYMGKRYKGK